MIGFLRGRVLEKRPNQVILDVQGVGYDVSIPVSSYYLLPDPPSEAQLHIHTHVREDALALYGFLTLGEKRVFEKLIGVSGIGPRLAVNILSGLEVSELAGAIRGGDIVKLTHIPGVGRKTAERMVLELRDKMAEAEVERSAAPAGFSAEQQDVLSALLNLGYQRGAAEKALSRAAERGASASFDTLLKQVLQILAK